MRTVLLSTVCSALASAVVSLITVHVAGVGNADAQTVGRQTATEFVLVDKQGSVRGYLGFNNDGSPMFAFYGTSAGLPPVVMLSSKSDGTTTLSLGSVGTSQVIASTAPNGAFLALERGAQPGVFSYASADGAGAIDIADSNGTSVWHVPSVPYAP